MANLLVAAFNRVDNRRFVAVPFNFNDYVGSEISPTAMSLVRDILLEEGLIEGQRGYHREASRSRGLEHSRRTRLRASAALLELFACYSVDRRSVGWDAKRDIIILKAPHDTAGAEPPEVSKSREVLIETTRVIGEATLALPDASWDRIAARSRLAGEVETERERAYAGDLTATSLYRAFNGTWERGGRIYGGWWINLPKVERHHLTIDDQNVVELDYARLHPTLLFARAGIELTFDPYTVPGIEGPAVRELGKRTFNRLVNRTPKGGGRDIRLLGSAEDREQLPGGVTFQEYLARFVERLAPVARWFGSGEGLRLQREDSDLAVGVLRALIAQGITVLPVHDSFIVQERHEGALRRAMMEQFRDRYGFNPDVRPAPPPPDGP